MTETVVEMAYELESLCNELLTELEETGVTHPVRLARLLQAIHEQTSHMEDWII